MQTQVTIAFLQMASIQGGFVDAKAFTSAELAEAQCWRWIHEQFERDELEPVEGETIAEAVERIQDADNYTNRDELPFDCWTLTTPLADRLDAH